MNFTSETPFGDVIERNVTLDEITGTGGFVVAAIDASGHGDRPRSTQGQSTVDRVSADATLAPAAGRRLLIDA